METKTKHLQDCQRVFKNYDKECPRCQELASGSAPRQGWGDFKRRMEAQSITAIKAHNCVVSHCSIVCTFGDW